MKVATQWMQVFCQQPQKRDHLKNIEVLAPDTLNSILQHIKKMAKIMNLLLLQQYKVQLIVIHVSQIMSILH